MISLSVFLSRFQISLGTFLSLVLSGEKKTKVSIYPISEILTKRERTPIS